MDIPSTGAIFTLGKSHLAENTQSYFYIKNDPVKRLISGPHQSAVICESGRLFVWGENHYGQLGIGGHGNKNNNNNGNGNGNGNGDIVSKPTCVKSLKTLGLKICDAAYGNNWAVIMTLSNEVFFTGRNIFPLDTHVAQHFTSAVVEQQPCAIIRKPFRLEEFDDYLSKNEETDNFITVQAGNEHFVVLTTTGRLIGCGSNAKQQLGDLEPDYDGHPVEIVLDAAVQQFACGPESTLVLTASGSLFLTGRLNEFVFAKFTELQKNLSATEQIIFMHISKISEIFIVTNVGNIYRSHESLRNKSLVFQRFYDYDSEENGPIWKLLKGFSFYAVLSKANKFLTTFSESGHHLKTFREISKFKNLRLLDIAVGDQHILVQGIPRSNQLSATVTAEPHSYMSRSFVLQPKDANGNEQRSASGKSLTKQKALKELETETHEELQAMGGSVAAAAGAGVATLEAVKHMSNEGQHEEKVEPAHETTDEANGNVIQELESEQNLQQQAEKVEQTKENEQGDNSKAEQQEMEPPKEEAASVAAVKSPKKVTENLDMTSTAPPVDTPVKQPTDSTALESLAKLPTPPAHTPTPPTSPAESMKSSKSHALERKDSQETKLRPHTPYPDSSAASTPQTVKRTPIRNFSYEAAMLHDDIDHTSPELVNSLDTVEENPLGIQISTPTPPTEEDEQLAVEITTKEDALDSSKVINEIRFINNGVDVTANVKQQMPDTPLADSIEELESDGEQMLHDLEQHVDKIVDEQQAAVAKASMGMGDSIENKLLETRNSIQTTMKKAATGARSAVETAGDRISTGAREAVDAAGKGAQRMADGARDAVDAAGKNAQRLASDAMHSMEQAGSNAAKAAANTRDSMGKAMDTVTNKISNEVQGAKENISSLFQIKAAKEVQLTTTPSTTPEDMEVKRNSGSVEGEEDERTTASVNSNHNSAGNSHPFEPANSNFNEEDMDPLDAVVERGKKAMQDELRALEEQRSQSHLQKPGQKDKEGAEQSKGFVQQILDGMRLSCRNEKAVQIEDEPPPQTQPAQPPHYSKNKVNSELSLQNGHNGEQQSSRVCTIL
ncbi:nucleolar and coiled-body phosphoprotein 1 [Drosophila busckii]|uniref:nucleolar and coiled-body phosphoprotein 1 n=1 Tax=Drosophila busckii TaxID=30019 RepID=UPI00083F0633|nr:nucleolar and coiled-body phosphoprotein 1 [Drosophila busckii]